MKDQNSYLIRVGRVISLRSLCNKKKLGSLEVRPPHVLFSRNLLIAKNAAWKPRKSDLESFLVVLFLFNLTTRILILRGKISRDPSSSF